MKLTQLEVTALLHAEWCSTAMGGRMASALLTGGTPVALDSLQHHGLLFWGPLSTELRTLPDATHWVALTPAGWEAAKQWRIDCAQRARIVGRAHDLYETGDADAPEAIKDRNGEVTLGLCRRCGQGEADLETFCPGTGAERAQGVVGFVKHYPQPHPDVAPIVRAELTVDLPDGTPLYARAERATVPEAPAECYVGANPEADTDPSRQLQPIKRASALSTASASASTLSTWD